jgi:hypothetical protein
MCYMYNTFEMDLVQPAQIWRQGTMCMLNLTQSHYWIRR